MRKRVGMALLLLGVVGGGLFFALGGRDRPPPAPPPGPPGEIAPEITPVVEPVPSPAETPLGDDLGDPLESAPRDLDLPSNPPAIKVPDGGDPKLRTRPANGEKPVADDPEPKPPVEPVPVPADPPTPGPDDPAESEEPPREEPTLVSGKEAAEAAPVAGPIDDPADLPSPEDIEEGKVPEGGDVAPPGEETFLSGLNDFLRIMTLDGKVQLKFTGRLYLDAALMDAQDELEALTGPFNSGGEFRTARIGVLGVVDWFEFKIDYDLASGQTLVGEPELKDLWIGARDIPLVGRIRVGRMKEPLGLEQWISGNARTFMEPALPKALTIGRNPGVLSFATELEGRLFWWAGMFGHTPNNNQFGEFGTNFSARVCGLPLLDKEEKRLLHLGLSASYRPSQSDKMSIAQRPESHLAPSIVFTPPFVADRQNFFGVEAAYRDGPFSLQGELQRYHVQSANSGPATYWGAYLYGSYILTGEHRLYRRGGFFRPRVTKVAFEDGVGGAWEIAVRLSHLDLISGNLSGGQVTDATLGLTWYMDDHSRFMVNYIRSNRRSVGHANILQCRLQIDF